MSKMSEGAAPDTASMEGFEGHYADLGDFTVGFESYSQNIDAAPWFQGVPDDRCQARHWGYVLVVGPMRG